MYIYIYLHSNKSCPSYSPSSWNDHFKLRQLEESKAQPLAPDRLRECQGRQKTVVFFGGQKWSNYSCIHMVVHVWEKKNSELGSMCFVRWRRSVLIIIALTSFDYPVQEWFSPTVESHRCHSSYYNGMRQNEANVKWCDAHIINYEEPVNPCALW